MKPLFPALLLTALSILLSGCPEPSIHPDSPDVGLSDVDDHLHDAGIQGDEDDDPLAIPSSIEFPSPEFLVEFNSTKRPEALVLDQHGEPLDAPIQWESPDPEILEISSGGFAIGRAVGAVDLIARVGDLEASWPARVVASLAREVSVVPANFNLLVGEEVQYIASARDAQNRPIEEGLVVFWSSSNESTASINEDGLARALAIGETEIIASVDGVEARVPLNVIDVEVESLEITPRTPAPLYPGAELQLQAQAFDLEDEFLSDVPIHWESSDPAVAQVGADGLLFALSPGETTIRASSGEVFDEIQITVIFTIQRVLSGGGFSCAIAIEKLFCWGENDQGQLGLGDVFARSQAAPVDFIGEIRDLSLGHGHACLIDGDHNVWCWGENTDGQTGAPAGPPLLEPTQISASTGFQRIAAGHSHTCALSLDDNIWCWGNNDARQSGHSGSSTHIPTQVASPESFQRIAAGDRHTCAIAADNRGYCWGANDRGQLGGGTPNSTLSSTPTLVVAGYTYAEISAGENHICGISPSGLPVCWGANDRGQLGNGNTTDSGVPNFVAIPQGSSLILLRTGAEHSCAPTTAGALLCWGAYADGRLGRSLSADQPSPTATDFSTAFVQFDLGAEHGCGHTEESEILCWGASPGSGHAPAAISFSDYF